MVKKMIAIARIAIQAPARNLVISTMISTTPVKQNPTALMVWLRRIRRRPCRPVSVRSSRFQCLIMPSWENVNETNTPTM